MRPTKEMILETKQLVSETDRNIRQIIKANDLQLNSLRNREDRDPNLNRKLIYGSAILIAFLLSYTIYRFFFFE
ncbi:MAG: hypothetical protein EHJ94_05240 [Deltaproteobacteria bacterium]|nr:MAG: hypothetical protein EHJ94_05240 [Deltaproteobacteria bacterium]